MNFLGGIGFMMLGFAVGNNYAGRAAARQLQLAANNAAAGVLAISQTPQPVVASGYAPPTMRYEVREIARLSALAARENLPLDVFLRRHGVRQWPPQVHDAVDRAHSHHDPPSHAVPMPYLYAADTSTTDLMQAMYG
jgi:hypothetical protein